MKFSEKAKEAILAVAPGLATALGGPVAGIAAKILADKFGATREDGTPDPRALEQAVLGTSPDAILKLRQAEMEWAEKQLQYGLDMEKLVVTDRANARDLAKVNMYPQIGLSIAFVLGYFALLYAFFFGNIKVDPEWKTEAAMLLGILTVNVPIIMQFWFGSSSGSARKTDILARSPPVGG